MPPTALYVHEAVWTPADLCWLGDKLVGGEGFEPSASRSRTAIAIGLGRAARGRLGSFRQRLKFARCRCVTPDAAWLLHALLQDLSDARHVLNLVRVSERPGSRTDCRTDERKGKRPANPAQSPMTFSWQDLTRPLAPTQDVTMLRGAGRECGRRVEAGRLRAAPRQARHPTRWRLT